MSWSDRLVPGSYRGVEFWLDSYEWGGGRHASVVEFPRKESVYVEDLGRRATTHRLNILLLGDDYPEQRDRLFEKLASRSAGWPYRPGSILTHPYLGQLSVLPLSWTVTESRREGRICRISIEYVEAPAPPPPKKAIDTTAAADSAATELEDATEAAAVDIDTAGPSSLGDSFSAGLKAIGKALESLDVFSGPADLVADYARDVNNLINQASTLATAPADAIATARSAISSIGSASRNFLGALSAYDGLFGWETTRDGPGAGSNGVSAPTGSGALGTSKTSAQINLNAARLERTIRNFALAGATRAAVRAPFETLAEAIVSRDRILAELDGQLEDTAARTLDSLEAIRIVLANQVPANAASLPNLRTVELPEEIPALVLAYRLYRNPDRDAEIALRNQARYPGLLPALVDLEVLSS